jgi:Na+/proline symporter
MGAAVALWLTVWLRRRNTGVGPLLLGAVTGALAGVAAGGGYWAGRDLVVDHPATDKLELYGVIGVAIAGALMGSLIGWVWRRRGSAGLVAGLLAGALAGLLLRDKHGGSDNDRVTHVLLEAILIVGVVTLTQALLDAWEERSARAAEPSRRALT